MTNDKGAAAPTREELADALAHMVSGHELMSRIYELSEQRNTFTAQDVKRELYGLITAKKVGAAAPSEEIALPPTGVDAHDFTMDTSEYWRRVVDVRDKQLIGALAQVASLTQERDRMKHSLKDVQHIALLEHDTAEEAEAERDRLQELVRGYREANVATENRFRLAVQGKPVLDMAEICERNAALLKQSADILAPSEGEK